MWKPLCSFRYFITKRPIPSSSDTDTWTLGKTTVKSDHELSHVTTLVDYHTILKAALLEGDALSWRVGHRVLSAMM